MRGVKISGLTESLSQIIQGMRKSELKAAASFRCWQVGALMMGDYRFPTGLGNLD